MSLSSCQLTLKDSYKVFVTTLVPHRAGVIAVVVFGLYGNSMAYFELASSQHMRELGRAQAWPDATACLKQHLH
jgi:hypothetical protein